ncbi:MAG: hypothetical protein AAGA54_17775 [Myxococcota bacterium]
MSDGPSIIVLNDVVHHAAILEVARRWGWKPVGDVRRGHFVLASERFTASDGTSIEYLEDHTANVRFMQLVGPGQRDIVRRLRQELPYYDEQVLLREVPQATEPVDWIRGLSRLAAYRPREFSTPYLALWSRALNHRDRAVRRAAIRTCYGCPWPELVPLVAGRIAVERELRKPLKTLAQHLERQHAGG